MHQAPPPPCVTQATLALNPAFSCTQNQIKVLYSSINTVSMKAHTHIYIYIYISPYSSLVNKRCQNRCRRDQAVCVFFSPTLCVRKLLVEWKRTSNEQITACHSSLSEAIMKSLVTRFSLKKSAVWMAKHPTVNRWTDMLLIQYEKGGNEVLLFKSTVHEPGVFPLWK